MTRFLATAMAAGLLLAISDPGFAAKRMSGTAAKSQARATTFSDSGRPSSRDPYPHRRDPYSYSRDDPYAPGVNWPKAD